MPNLPITSLAELEVKLASFEILPDDWDTYGAKAISPILTARARAIWEQLRPRSAHVCPGGDGLVEFSMRSAHWRLSINVEGTEDMYAFYSTDTDEPDEIGSLDIPRVRFLLAEMGLAGE